MIQRILEAGQRKTFYYVRIRDQGYKLSKLFFLLNRDSCPDHANSVSLIHNLDWNMILQSDPQKFNISKQMIDEKGLKTDIEVDGGVNLENVTEVMDAGANIIVAGSAVFKGDISENVERFLDVLKE